MLLALLAGLAHARSDVVVLVSDSLSAYDAPVARFQASIGHASTVIDLEGSRERADAVVKQLAADPPPLVFAVGAKAAFVMVNDLPTVPTVYAMVLEPSRYGISGTQVTGVSSQVPPEAALSQFRVFVPEVAHLGVLLSTGNVGPSTQASLNAARELGFQLSVQRVTNAKDLRAAFDRMADEVDAIWLLPDPVTLTPESFRFLRNETLRHKLPMLAGTETLVRAGALLCVTPDREVVGQQAAELAKRVMEGGELPGTIPPAEPASIRVVLNRDTLDALGVPIDPLLLDFADAVVREGEGR